MAGGKDVARITITGELRGQLLENGDAAAKVGLRLIWLAQEYVEIAGHSVSAGGVVKVDGLSGREFWEIAMKQFPVGARRRLGGSDGLSDGLGCGRCCGSG